MVRYTPGSCAHGLIFFIYCELFGPHVFKRVLAYFPLPSRLSSGLFLFWVLLVKPSLYVDLLISMSMFMLLGRGPQVSPLPSWPILGSIRGKGTPPQTLAVIWEKKKESPPSRVAAHGGSRMESNRRRRRRRCRRTQPCRCRRYYRHSLPRPRGRCRRHRTQLCHCHRRTTPLVLLCYAALPKPPPLPPPPQDLLLFPLGRHRLPPLPVSTSDLLLVPPPPVTSFPLSFTPSPDQLPSDAQPKPPPSPHCSPSQIPPFRSHWIQPHPRRSSHSSSTEFTLRVSPPDVHACSAQSPQCPTWIHPCEATVKLPWVLPLPQSYLPLPDAHLGPNPTFPVWSSLLLPSCSISSPSAHSKFCSPLQFTIRALLTELTHRIHPPNPHLPIPSLNSTQSNPFSDSTSKFPSWIQSVTQPLARCRPVEFSPFVRLTRVPAPFLTWISFLRSCLPFPTLVLSHCHTMWNPYPLHGQHPIPPPPNSANSGILPNSSPSSTNPPPFTSIPPSPPRAILLLIHLTPLYSTAWVHAANPPNSLPSPAESIFATGRPLPSPIAPLFFQSFPIFLLCDYTGIYDSKLCIFHEHLA